MQTIRCIGSRVPCKQTINFNGITRSKHRVVLKHHPGRIAAMANDIDGPTDDEESNNQGSSLSSEDLNIVVNFYTRIASKKEAAAEEPTIAIDLKLEGDGGRASDTSISSEQQPPLLSEAETKPETPPPPPPQLEEAPTPTETVLLPSDAASVHDENSPSQNKHRIQQLQDELLALLSTLDRGLAASGDDITRVDNLALQLENLGEPVILDINISTSTNSNRKSGLELLDGRWRLEYSSGFSGGNLGGRRPGPPADLAPVHLGAVYQDIFVAAKELDNVVTLSAKISLASLFKVDPPAVTARLRHSFSIEGVATVRIVFENTVAKTSGGIGGWLNMLPQFETPMLPESLRPVSSNLRDATFEVSFLDERMRLTRGDRGELRIFVKES